MQRVDMDWQGQEPVLKGSQVIYATRQPGRLPDERRMGGEDIPGTKRDSRVVRNRAPAACHRTCCRKHEREPGEHVRACPQCGNSTVHGQSPIGSHGFHLQLRYHQAQFHAVACSHAATADRPGSSLPHARPAGARKVGIPGSATTCQRRLRNDPVLALGHLPPDHGLGAVAKVMPLPPDLRRTGHGCKRVTVDPVERGALRVRWSR